ncbi:hypothetical protein CSW58_02900 [Caulobacter sp. B11]|nr:hypothetical protein CSW58_02900 [Caulobacter sp. B11]
MDRFTSPVLALSRPARTVVRPAAPLNRPHRAFGRQLDALPSRWSEENYGAAWEGAASILDIPGGRGRRALKLLGLGDGYPRGGGGMGTELRQSTLASLQSPDIQMSTLRAAPPS